MLASIDAMHYTDIQDIPNQQGVNTMKHFKRANLLKSSTVTFDPSTTMAYSYGWWCFVKPINGLIVFNDYRYSPSTGKQQGKVRSLLDTLGIKVDLYVECPEGLQDSNYLESITSHYMDKISELQAAMLKPRSQKKKNLERTEQIKIIEEKIKFFNEKLSTKKAV